MRAVKLLHISAFYHISVYTYTGNFYFVDLFASGRKNRYLKYSLHIVGWLAFLLLPSAFSLEGSVDFHHLFDNQHKLNNLFYYILLIVFSYVNYLFIVPRFYLKKKYVTYFSIIIICFFVVIFLPESLDAHDKPLPPKFPGQPGPAHVSFAKEFMATLIISTAHIRINNRLPGVPLYHLFEIG